MRKIISLLLVAVMVIALAACGSSAPAAPETPAAPAAPATPAEPAAPAAPAEPEVDPNAPELSKVRLNWGGSGNILVALALENGYLAEEGIEIEFVQATNNSDMLTLLQSADAPGEYDQDQNDSQGKGSDFQNLLHGVTPGRTECSSAAA